MKQTPNPLSWRACLPHVIGPVVIGAGIYLLFRARHLSALVWLDSMGFGQPLSTARVYALPVRDALPDWVLFSLPDGLWVYALTAAMAFIWRGSKHPARYIWLAAGAGLGAGGELGQIFGVVPGTFDTVDLVASFAAFAAAVLLTRTRPVHAA